MQRTTLISVMIASATAIGCGPSQSGDLIQAPPEAFARGDLGPCQVDSENLDAPDLRERRASCFVPRSETPGERPEGLSVVRVEFGVAVRPSEPLFFTIEMRNMKREPLAVSFPEGCSTWEPTVRDPQRSFGCGVGCGTPADMLQLELMPGARVRKRIALRAVRVLDCSGAEVEPLAPGIHQVDVTLPWLLAGTVNQTDVFTTPIEVLR